VLSLSEVSNITSSLHACDEAISATRHSLYEFLSFRAFAQCSSQKRDVLRETAFLNKAVRPKPLHQFLLSKQSPAVFHKRQEHIERLRSERNKVPIAQQQPFLSVESERAEFE